MRSLYGYDDDCNNVFRASYETNLQNRSNDIRTEWDCDARAPGATATKLEIHGIQQRVVGGQC